MERMEPGLSMGPAGGKADGCRVLREQCSFGVTQGLMGAQTERLR